MSLTVAAVIVFLGSAAQHFGILPIAVGSGMTQGANAAAAIAETISGAFLVLAAVGLVARARWAGRASLVAYTVAITAVLIGVLVLAGRPGSGVRQTMDVHVLMLALLVPGIATLTAWRTD